MEYALQFQSSFSDDEDETFYESFQTPCRQPLSTTSSRQIQSPDSSCYPSDGESTVGNFTDEELDDVDDEVLDYKEASDDPSTSVTAVDPANDGDKSPTREREATLNVKELQF